MTDEHDVEVPWNGLTLSGTVSLPGGDGPRAAVLLMQGSGEADRDCGGYFAPIKATFLERGLATFAVDKPGCGRSSGDWREHALSDRADQATAAIEALGQVPGVDPGRIGVWGQSQGGWMAQILAGRGLDLLFAIANSGPSIGVAEQNLFSIEHTMRADGRPESDIDAALAFLDRAQGAARDGVDPSTIEREILEPAGRESWFAELYGPAEPADWRFLWRLIEEDYRPLESLARVTCPFLAIYGGADLLVPAWRGAEETGRALQKAGAADATVVTFPGANHRIKDPETDQFVPGYLELLGDWAATRS